MIQVETLAISAGRIIINGYVQKPVEISLKLVDSIYYAAYIEAQEKPKEKLPGPVPEKKKKDD